MGESNAFLLNHLSCFPSQVDNEIKKKIKTWEDENETYFMIKGMRYADYLEHQKLEYETETKLKKEEKARMKKVELSQEVHFGSRSKRKCPGTPGKVGGNSKLARVNIRFIDIPSFYIFLSFDAFLRSVFLIL